MSGKNVVSKVAVEEEKGREVAERRMIAISKLWRENASYIFDQSKESIVSPMFNRLSS